MRNRAVTLILLLLTAPAVGAAAQNAPGWDPGAPLATRAELEELMHRLEETSRSGTYSPTIREQAAEQALQVKKRLEDGDMQFNDGLILDVKGAPHDSLSRTYLVSPQRRIVISTVGEVSLAGILRSELESHLTSEFAKSLRGATVTMRVPIRIEIVGAVTKPGPTFVPPELPLLEVINSATGAGGIKDGASLDNLRVIRGGKVVLDGKEWNSAREQNLTIEQIGLRNGDVVQIPTATAGLFSNVRRLAGALSGLTSIFLLARRLGVL